MPRTPTRHLLTRAAAALLVLAGTVSLFVTALGGNG